MKSAKEKSCHVMGVWKWVELITITHGDAGLPLVRPVARVCETEGRLRFTVLEWRIVVDCGKGVRTAGLSCVTTGSDRNACQERAYFVSV